MNTTSYASMICDKINLLYVVIDVHPVKRHVCIVYTSL